MPAGSVVGPIGMEVALCPCCDAVATWVLGELHCLFCGCVHVPDRTYFERIGRGLERGAVLRRVDAFERVLRTRGRAGRA